MLISYKTVVLVHTAQLISKLTGYHAALTNSGEFYLLLPIQSFFRMVRGCTTTPPSYDEPCDEGSSRNGKYKVWLLFTSFLTNLRTAVFHVIHVLRATVATMSQKRSPKNSPPLSGCHNVTRASTTRIWMVICSVIRSAPKCSLIQMVSQAPCTVLNMLMLHAIPLPLIMLTTTTQTVRSRLLCTKMNVLFSTNPG